MKRKPFDQLSPTFAQLANKLHFIEQYYKTTVHPFGMNDHRRKNQLQVCQNMAREELKKAYITIGKQLEK